MSRPTKGEAALSERMDIRLTAADKAALEQIAEERNVSPADLVRTALGTWLAVAKPSRGA